MNFIPGKIATHSGYVTIRVNEGGYCDDGVIIGDTSVAEMLGKLFDIPPSTRGSAANWSKELPEVLIMIQVLDRQE